MARISCPCGLNLEVSDDFQVDEIRRSYDRHTCEFHTPVPEKSKGWPDAVMYTVGALVFLAVVFIICGGLR